MAVVVNDDRISSPILSRYDVAIVLNQPSLDKFEPKLKPGGILIYDSYGIINPPKRSDIKVYSLDAMCTLRTAQSVFHCKRKRGGESSVQDTSRTPPRSYPAEHGGYKDRKGNHKGNVKNHIIIEETAECRLKHSAVSCVCIQAGQPICCPSVSVQCARRCVRPTVRAAHTFSTCPKPCPKQPLRDALHPHLQAHLTPS